MAQCGAHSAADWMLIKIRAYRGTVAVYIRDDDAQLFALSAHQAKTPPRCRLAGVYGKGIRYRDAVADMAELLSDYRGANDD